MGHSDKEQGTISEPEQFHKETVKCFFVSIHYSIFLKIRLPDIKAQVVFFFFFRR